METMQKVLLVEDNEMNRDMLSRRLNRKGFHIITAADGQSGIDTAVSEQPDIIIMDMSLPVIDGWTATQQLKANPATATIPIVALTAHAMATDRDRAFAVGCDEYDSKPIDLPRLLEKMKKLLPANPNSGNT
jgi:CheY-like chemotaxis protein